MPRGLLPAAFAIAMSVQVAAVQRGSSLTVLLTVAGTAHSQRHILQIREVPPLLLRLFP